MNKRGVFVILISILILVIFSFVIYQNFKSEKNFLTGLAISTFQPSSSTGNDTYIRQDSGINYYSATTMKVGKTAGGLEFRPLIRFDLSSISSSDTIQEAKLQLYLETTTAENFTIKVYRVTSSWNHSATNWTSKDNATSWDTAGGDYNEEIASVEFGNITGIYYNFTISSLARGWVNGTYSNYGLILIQSDANNSEIKEFSSSESLTASQRPLLYVDHVSNAAPSILNLSTDTTSSNPKDVGEAVNFSISWNDLESDTAQGFFCNTSSANISGCNETTFCNTSLALTNPLSCSYTTLSTNNRTQNFWAIICDDTNCSAVNQSQFYMNHLPVALVTTPNGGETANQSNGNYTIKFNVSDADSDYLTANLHYGTSQNSTTNSIASNLNLTQRCADTDNLTTTTNNCSYSWNTTGIYGTGFYVTIIINDSYAVANDSSNSGFNIYSIVDSTPPSITAQWVEASIYSGKQTNIYANITEENINTVWASFNFSAPNVTLLNDSTEVFNATFTAPRIGNYKFKIYANDSVGNLNNSMAWTEFSTTKPVAVNQTQILPSSALPYQTIRMTSELNATDNLRDVYAYLYVPSGFSFLSNYSQNSSIGNLTSNQTKTAEWFLSTPITETTYNLNVTFTDYYSNQWNTSNSAIQVTSSIGGGYDLYISGYPEVETTDNYYVEAYFKQSGVYSNPDSIFITLVDAAGSTVVGPVAMTSKSTGIYNYSYTIGASVVEGQWKTMVNATESSANYSDIEFWKVVGGPFDVRSITVVDSTISSMNISVITENTGGANKDLTLTWNLTREDTSAILDSGSDTFMVSANSEKLWSVNPETSYVGAVRITFLGTYSGTEKAGAYKTFTTTSGGTCGDLTCNNGETCSTCPGDCGACSSGGTGGGGGGGATKKFPEINFTQYEKEILLTKNIEKNITLKITNTGKEKMTDVSLELEGLNPDYYKITPLKIDSISVGESAEFGILFLIQDFVGEQNFNYAVKSKEVAEKQLAKINVLQVKDYFLEELKRLKEKIEKLKIYDDKILELTECENLTNILEMEIEKEEFINAKADLDKAEKCLKNIEDEIKEEVKTAKIKMQGNIFWIITWALIGILIIALFLIIYFLYKKLGIVGFLKSSQENYQNVKPEKVKRKTFDEKLKEIEDKLKES